ncbi:unnamed protein product [Durusdinium trenchii]|uniref:Uncharacterized protein n=1 Tax=Durusdinium trenchii TaxID=1381693 RepID=A0ABP0RPU3_9DINO
MEMGEFSLHDLQRGVSSAISSFQQNSLSVGVDVDQEDDGERSKPRASISPQKRLGRPTRSKMTAVEEKRQQLARMRMSTISAANFPVEKRRTLKPLVEYREKSEKGENEESGEKLGHESTSLDHLSGDLKFCYPLLQTWS